jgi:hypothetical protein
MELPAPDGFVKAWARARLRQHRHLEFRLAIPTPPEAAG